MTVFDNHKALWMWEFRVQAEKTLPEACATAKNLAGAELLLVKAMDGTAWMALFDPPPADSSSSGGYGSLAQFQADAAAAAGQGVTVIPWVVPHGQNPPAEAAIHAQLGPVLMVDVEPYPGFWTAPAGNLPAYLQALRQNGVRELHITIDPRPSALAALDGPGTFTGYVDGVHPQAYWTDFAIAPLSVLPMLQALQSHPTPDHRPPTPAVYPVLPGDGNAQDLADVWQAAQAIGCPGVSVWRLGSMDAIQLAAFARLTTPDASHPTPPLEERVAGLEGQLARLNQVLTKRFIAMREALDPDTPPV